MKIKTCILTILLAGDLINSHARDTWAQKPNFDFWEQTSEGVVNGDFELGNTGFTNGYVYVSPDGRNMNTEGQYTVGPDPSRVSIWTDWVRFGDHTSGRGNMLIANGSPDPDTSVWTQTISVVPNTNYVFSFWAATVNVLSGSPTVLQPFINSSAVGDAFMLPVNGGTWTQNSVNWFSGASTTAVVSIIDTNTVRATNDFALDDISFQEGSAGLSFDFRETGSMAVARYSVKAVLLRDGRVLVAGGQDSNGSPLASAELYDPASGTWSVTGSLTTPRSAHTATLMRNGKVLVAAGATVFDNSAELYDPATGTWSATGSLNHARTFHTATLLADGKVLVAGGFYDSGVLASAELYDPVTGTWTRTGRLVRPRANHVATLLPDGKVLVAGGNNAAGTIIFADAELYDPVNGTWSATGRLDTARVRSSMTLLRNGLVLVTGGLTNNDLEPLASSELYDPASGTWSRTGALSTGVELHTATLLPNGGVLVTGGISTRAVANVEIYNPNNGTWSSTENLTTPRFRHSATLMRNGKVLVAGGEDGSGTTASAELGSRIPQ